MNFTPISDGVDIWFRQVAGTLTAGYRELVWDILNRVLEATPQFSGKATANWNVSIGSPNFNWDESLGSDIPLDGRTTALVRGDRHWIEVALSRNRPIVEAIRYRDKVFLSNGVRGDAGSYLKSDESLDYLNAIQVPGYWRDRLRAANQPYEAVQESLIIVATEHGSRGLTLPRVGGATFQPYDY